MKKITYDIEWELDKSHWWFVGRRKLLNHLLASLNIPRDSLIIDIGCGVGSNISLLGSLGLNLIGIDMDLYGLSLAKKRFPNIPLVNGDLLKLPFKSNSFYCVIATDILEHLDQDHIGMEEINRVLKPGGANIITVPAFKFLWGIQDVIGMHHRRYTKKGLLKLLEGQEFRIMKSSYFNLFLFFPILAARYLIRFFKLKVESENEINIPLINFILKSVFLFEVYLLKYISFPIGVSIFCIAKK